MSCSKMSVGHSFGWANAPAASLTSGLITHSYIAISQGSEVTDSVTAGFFFPPLNLSICVNITRFKNKQIQRYFGACLGIV